MTRVERGDINATGIVLLVAGFLALIVGASLAISAQRDADSIDHWDRIMYPNEYNSHKAAANTAWTVAKIGALLMFLGFVIAIAVRSRLAAGVLLLLMGFLVVIVGARLAISAQSDADSMSYQDKAYFPDEYDSYMAAISDGLTLAATGAILMSVGLATDVAIRRASCQPRSQ